MHERGDTLGYFILFHETLRNLLATAPPPDSRG